MILMPESPRKICVVVNSRANYGRIKSVMRAVSQHPKLKLQLLVGASALLHRFGSVVDVIRADGFEPTAVVHSIVEGETPTTMAKSTGLGILELASQFENIKPDVVLTVADRFETIATAIAASYMNIPVAHTQGGEVTGSIDESVRHAVTKLSHIHFPSSQRAYEFLLRMGEDAGQGASHRLPGDGRGGGFRSLAAAGPVPALCRRRRRYRSEASLTSSCCSIR